MRDYPPLVWGTTPPSDMPPNAGLSETTKNGTINQLNLGKGSTMTREYQLSRCEAVTRLKARYEEQSELYPRMIEQLTLQQFIRTNICHVRTYGLLADYQERK